jgi:hypothetical protein
MIDPIHPEKNHPASVIDTFAHVIEQAKDIFDYLQLGEDSIGPVKSNIFQEAYLLVGKDAVPRLMSQEDIVELACPGEQAQRFSIAVMASDSGETSVEVVIGAPVIIDGDHVDKTPQKIVSAATGSASGNSLAFDSLAETVGVRYHSETKELSAFVAGRSSTYYLQEELDDIPKETINYILQAMQQLRIGLELDGIEDVLVLKQLGGAVTTRLFTIAYADSALYRHPVTYDREPNKSN